MADIARMLSKLDKALVARSELKKQPIEKNRYTSANNAKANKASNHDVGFISPYEKNKPPIKNPPRSKIGLSRDNVPSGPGLPYAHIDDDKTGSRSVTDKRGATEIPRVELRPGKNKNEPWRLVPVTGPDGKVIYDPLPYNYPLLLNPFSDPPYMPVDFKVKRVPVVSAKGEVKLDYDGNPIMQLARDEDGRYVPELDAQGNPVPLPVKRNKDGDLAMLYQIDPDYVKNRIGVHSLGVDKDAMYVENLLRNGATWDEAMDTLKKDQARTLANQERYAWLKRLSTILQDADNLGLGAKGEDGASVPHHAVNRELMKWYWEKPKQEEFQEGIIPRLADDILKHRNPYLSPGMPVGRLQEYTDPETGKTRFRVWHPIKGPIEFLTPTTRLKKKHVRAIADALGLMDNSTSIKRRMADALNNARNGIDDGTLFHGLTASEMLEYSDLNKRLNADPQNPAAKEWRKRSNELSRKMNFDAMTESRAEDLFELYNDPDAYSKNYISVDPSRANDLAVKLMNNNPEMWGWLTSEGRENDLADIIRLFSSLPRDVAERFAETGMLDLNPLPGYKPPKHSTLGDEIRDRTIFTEMARRRSSAENWLSNKENQELASEALKFFGTDDGRKFLQENGYGDPLASHNRYLAMKEKLPALNEKLPELWKKVKALKDEIAESTDPDIRKKNEQTLDRVMKEITGIVDYEDRIKMYEGSVRGDSEYGRQPLLEAAMILVNEKIEEERRLKEAEIKEQNTAASDLYHSVLDDAYDQISLPSGTVFESDENDAEARWTEELSKKRETAVKLNQLYGEYQDGYLRGDKAKKDNALEKVKAMYPDAKGDELKDILTTGKNASAIINRYDPDVKGSMFEIEAKEMLNRDPNERVEDKELREQIEASGRVNKQLPTDQAMENIYGPGWADAVYGSMSKGLIDKATKALNQLADRTRPLNTNSKGIVGTLNQLKTLAEHAGDDSRYARLADELEQAKADRDRLGNLANPIPYETNPKYNHGNGKNAKTPLARLMEKEAEEEAEQEEAAKRAEATLKRKEREERERQEAEATEVLDGDAAASAGDTKRKTEERTVVPLTPEDRRLAAQARDAANNSDFVAPQSDASKRLNQTINGYEIVNTGLNADGSKIKQDTPSPSGHVGQTRGQEFPDLPREEKRKIIRDAESTNDKVLNKENMNLNKIRPMYTSDSDEDDAGDKSVENSIPIKLSVSTMEDMRNMSLRDMMDSIAKNTGKDGHPYGAPIGGSVFAFGCVPVRMGGDGRERGMPADIPTAKTNDEGLTSRRVEMGRVRSDR